MITPEQFAVGKTYVEMASSRGRFDPARRRQFAIVRVQSTLKVKQDEAAAIVDAVTAELDKQPEPVAPAPVTPSAADHIAAEDKPAIPAPVSKKKKAKK